jgi:hypothetical protein
MPADELDFWVIHFNHQADEHKKAVNKSKSKARK